MSRHLIIAITRRQGPMTAKQLAMETGLQESTVRTNVRRARAHGTKYLRIAAWAGDVPMYGPGPGDDVDGGTTGDKILAYLETHEPAPAVVIAAAIGLTTAVVDPAIRRLRDKGRVHVVDWKRRVGERGGREAGVFKSGPGRDAPRPDFTGMARVYEQRRVEKRRVARIIKGLPVRNTGAKPTNGPTAGFFDALMR